LGDVLGRQPISQGPIEERMHSVLGPRRTFLAITALNRTQYPSDVIALVVLWRLRYKLSLRDLAEMFLIRGIVFSHEAVRDWEAKLTPAMAEELRHRRRRHIGRSWYVDETFIKVHGHWRAPSTCRHEHALAGWNA
jgi:hypothetical protein